MDQNSNMSNKNLANSKLLVDAKGSSIRFYLDGFNPLAFLRLTELIKKYGGRVTRPNFDTLTLSKPNHIAGTNHMRFHINWLHNSIKANKRQDINRYLLPEPVQKNIFYCVPPIPTGCICIKFSNRAKKMPQLQRETTGEKERGISDGPIGTVQKNGRDKANIVENQGSPHTESSIRANEKDMSNVVINTENKNAEVSTNIPQHHEVPAVGGRVYSVTAALAGEEETLCSKIMQPPPALSPQNHSFSNPIAVNSVPFYNEVSPTLSKKIVIINTDQVQNQNRHQNENPSDEDESGILNSIVGSP